MLNFVNNGTDDAILKSLPIEDEGCSEDLVKAMSKQGLVQKDVTVQGKNGKTFTRKQWVKSGGTSAGDSSKQKSVPDAVKECGVSGSETIQELEKIRHDLYKEMTYCYKKYDKALASNASDANTWGIMAGGKQKRLGALDNYIKSVKSIQDSQSSPTQSASPDGFTESGDGSYSKPLVISNGSESYQIWAEGSHIKGSMPGKQDSSNSRDIKDFTQSGFDKFDEVKDYVKKYFFSSKTTDISTKNNNISKKSGISFDKPVDGDTKKALSQMLASGKSRQDIMTAAKAAGITWKENDHEGINWMRASMAIQKHMNGDTSKSTKNTVSSGNNSKSTTKEEKNKSVKSTYDVTPESDITSSMVTDGAVFNFDGTTNGKSGNGLGNMVYKISKHLEVGDEIVVSNNTVGYITPNPTKADLKGHYREIRLVITNKYQNGNRGYTVIYGGKDEYKQKGQKAIQSQEDRSWRDITDGALFLIAANKYTLKVNKGVYL